MRDSNGNEIRPPAEQAITLRMPWRMWLEIRDLARTHGRSASAEIRAAISYWSELHKHAAMFAGKEGQDGKED